jgi:hypothetical protein
MKSDKIVKIKATLLIILIICSAGMHRNRVYTGSIPDGTDSAWTLKTATGKSILIRESHPDGLSLSRIEIVAADFRDNNSFVLDSCDPLLRTELTDLDNDGFNELFLITKSAGSGSSGTIYGFGSENDNRFVKIGMMAASEKEYQEGGELEGYMGHDKYYFEKGFLIREFPVYKNSDSNAIPTGGTKKVFYQYKNFKLSFFKVVKAE